jgi:hypothetical protein
MARWESEPFDKQRLIETYAEIVRGREKETENAAQSLETIRKVWEPRLAFTEKLIVLNTGMFALTFSYLGALGSHAAESLSQAFLPVICAAWVSLLVAIVTGACTTCRFRAPSRIFSSHSAVCRRSTPARIKHDELWTLLA